MDVSVMSVVTRGALPNGTAEQQKHETQNDLVLVSIPLTLLTANVKIL